MQQALTQHAAELESLRQDHQQAVQQQQQAREAELQAAEAKARRDAEALRTAAAGSQSQLEQHLRCVGCMYVCVP